MSATSDDEPALDGEEWEEWGGEMIWAVGHTSGGAPYGLTRDEYRRINERAARGAGWARAKHVLREVVGRELGEIVDIGFVKKIGDGLSREVFAAEIVLRDGRCDQFAVALPRADTDRELDVRTMRELRLVARLQRTALPFRVPEVVGAFPVGDRLALVRRFVRGVELDLRAGRQPSVRPWQIVGEVAAAVHQIPSVQVCDVVSGFATRRDHARSALAVFDGLGEPELRDGRAWAEQQIPPDEPSALLHGDLLGHNILLSPDGPHYVTDWEHVTCGDPAYDLAIVTRGHKQPFQLAGGLEKLLDVYRAHSGRDITTAHIGVHELCLHAAWYRDAIASRGRASAANELGIIRGLIKRLTRR